MTGRSWPKIPAAKPLEWPAEGHRYNETGIAGLANRPGAGRKPALTAAQMAELKAVALAGPDRATDGLVRWRCADLQGVIAGRFAVKVCERTVGKLGSLQESALGVR